MARVSFTLRGSNAYNSASVGGSFLQYPIGSAGYPARLDSSGSVVYDNYLQGAGVTLAPTGTATATSSSFYLDATCATYGSVDVSWNIAISTVSVTPSVTGVVLVYSSKGHPQTVSSGTVLVDSSTVFSYTHNNVEQGRWSYYSLFAHYTSTAGDDYYELLASTESLVVKDYKSTHLLWSRIPAYYRALDQQSGTFDHLEYLGTLPDTGPVGPLYRYMAIFGFNMDYLRTLIDFQMVSNDPDYGNSETLDAVADELGVGLRSESLGAARLRSLLYDIGYLRRTKGTPSSIRGSINTLGRESVYLDTTAATLKLAPQRINYITVPKNGSGIITYRAAANTEATTPTSFSTSTGATGTFTFVSPNQFYTTGASASIQGLVVHLSSPIPVYLNDTVFYSVQGAGAGATGTEAIKWVRLVNAAGTTMGIQYNPLRINGSKAFEVSVGANASSTAWTNSYIEYFVDLSSTSSGSPFTNASLLAERFTLGEYFDGDFVRGGYLSGTSTKKDYHWYGSANASPSLYTELSEPTHQMLAQFIPNVLPITEMNKYTVSYNYVPGL